MRLKEKELMIFVRFVSFFLSLYHHLFILDLAFTENVILIANPSKSGGDWWFGRNVVSGKSGLFPKTYIEIVKPGALFDYLIFLPWVAVLAKQKTQNCCTRFRSSLSLLTFMPERPITPPIISYISSLVDTDVYFSSSVKAKATYEYMASNADEMSFGEGEVVDVVEREEDEAWWKAEKGGVVYIVPASYLEVEDG